MDLLSVIGPWHFRQDISIREIKRRTRLARNTTRKYLRADAVEPIFKVPNRPSKLGLFAEKHSTWLRVASGKIDHRSPTAVIQIPFKTVPTSVNHSLAAQMSFPLWPEHILRPNDSVVFVSRNIPAGKRCLAQRLPLLVRNLGDACCLVIADSGGERCH